MVPEWPYPEKREISSISIVGGSFATWTPTSQAPALHRDGGTISLDVYISTGS